MTNEKAMELLNGMYKDEMVVDKRNALLMAAQALSHELEGKMCSAAESLFGVDDVDFVSINISKQDGKMRTYTIEAEDE